MVTTSPAPTPEPINDRPRAAKGGQYGSNGEWYKGGEYMPNGSTSGSNGGDSNFWNAAILTELRKTNERLDKLNKETKRNGTRTSDLLSGLVGSADLIELAIAGGLTVLICSLAVVSEPEAFNMGELGEGNFNAPAREGMAIASYEVTSNFGIRKHPITGEYKPHEGVDLNTPEFTPLYMIG